MFPKGRLRQEQLVSEELALKKAIFAHEQARTKLAVFEQYTKLKSIDELRAAVEKLRSDLIAAKSRWELEKQRESELERKVANATTSRSESESN